MKKFLKVLFIIVVIFIVGIVCIAAYVKVALPKAAPAPDLKIAITPQRVERGKYLANHVAICMDCHSQRNWNLYAGPIKEGAFGAGGERFGKEMQFPGTLYSKNITPYALKSWTDGEIFRAITTGVSKNGSALFPLMGYPTYGKMDKEDVYSIIAYLRTLPEIKNDVPERKLDFPVNIIVNTIPAKAQFTTKPDTNNQLQYGKYLTATARCVDCHSKVKNGDVIAGTEFGGGRQFYFPNGTVTTSANITHDKETGIGNWSEEVFIRRFKQYADTAHFSKPVSPNDFNTPMPWLMYAGMKQNDLAAIYAYLKTVKPIKNKVEKFAGK